MYKTYVKETENMSSYDKEWVLQDIFEETLVIKKALDISDTYFNEDTEAIMMYIK